MDQALLRRRASELEELLTRYAAVDPEAARLYGALQGLLAKAQGGLIVDSMNWSELPGGHSFQEGSLRKYPDLESSYSRFAIEVTGGETPALRALRKAMNRDQK
jgi:hypothetical protein